ncbi:MAG: helix-turn-helix domain-containing protein [Acidimicrobiales bacterium]
MAKRREDAKVETLRAERSLNPRPEAVVDEAFAASEFLDARDVVQVKYEMVRRVRVEGDAVSRSASAFGFSRPSFYEAAAALDAGGLAALVPARPGPRRAHKLTDEVLAFARERLEDDASLRSADLADAIAERFGVRVHPRSVERALARPEEGPKRGDGR